MHDFSFRIIFGPKLGHWDLKMGWICLEFEGDDAL